MPKVSADRLGHKQVFLLQGRFTARDKKTRNAILDPQLSWISQECRTVSSAPPSTPLNLSLTILTHLHHLQNL